MNPLLMEWLLAHPGAPRPLVSEWGNFLCPQCGGEASVGYPRCFLCGRAITDDEVARYTREKAEYDDCDFLTYVPYTPDDISRDLLLDGNVYISAIGSGITRIGQLTNSVFTINNSAVRSTDALDALSYGLRTGGSITRLGSSAVEQPGSSSGS